MKLLGWLRKITHDPFITSVLCLLAVGSILRFNGLERKQYWKDEAGVSMVTTGHRIYDLFGEQKDGTFLAGNFFKLQRVSPDRGFSSTVLRAATDESSHAPLYYILLRIWINLFGDSIGSIRGFSAFLSLSLFPAIYFLCVNLFESEEAGWIGVMLTAVSPYQFLFAQEAREYILWLVVTCFSSIALLRGKLRQYLILCLLDIYSSFFTFFVAAGQLAFVYFSPNQEAYSFFKSRKFWWARFVTILIGLPIVFNMFWHLDDIRRATAWMTHFPGLGKYTRAVLSELYRVFFDLNLPPGSTFSQHPLQAVTIAAVLLTELGAAVFFFYRADRRSKIFILCLSLSALLPTMGVDLLFGGRRALSPRFLLTFFLSLQLMVTFTLAKLLSSSDQRLRFYARGMAVFFATLGLYSTYTNSVSDTWWNKGVTGDYKAMAQAVNDAPAPRLIISHDYRESLGLSRYLDPSVEIMRSPPFPTMEKVQAWKSVFLLLGDPDESPDFYIEKGVKVQLVNGNFWRLGQ